MLKHPNISHDRCYETDKEGASSFLLIGLVTSNSHVRASIWCFFVSMAPSTSVLRWSPSTTWRYRSERVFICRCMSSWISVAEMKPPVARKTVNTHVVLFLPICWHPDVWNKCWKHIWARWWPSSWHSKQRICEIPQLSGMLSSLINSSIRVSKM